jgi:hypothetical protein
LKSVGQFGGNQVKLINISRRGALIESRERLSPKTSISLRLTTKKSVYIVKGRIVRSSPSPLNKREFQSAIAFHEDFKIMPPGIDEDFESYLQVLLKGGIAD